MSPKLYFLSDYYDRYYGTLKPCFEKNAKIELLELESNMCLYLCHEQIVSIIRVQSWVSMKSECWEKTV